MGSRIVHYCGIYAHAKATGQNFYNMPKTITPEECGRMSRDLTIQIGDETHPLEMDALNYVKSYTHGGISYTTTSKNKNKQTKSSTFNNSKTPKLQNSTTP